MKQTIAFIFLAFLYACDRVPSPKPVIVAVSPHLLRAVKCNPSDDSLYLYSDGHLVSKERQDTERYLLVSYVTSLKAQTNYYPIEGNYWFSFKGDFPNKNLLDSQIYADLPLQKKCYQRIIIKSIFEFRSADDFYSFGFKYKGDPSPKVKKCCEPPHLIYSNDGSDGPTWIPFHSDTTSIPK